MSLLGVGVLLCGVVVSLASLGCGRILTPKGPGEPCTRTTECRSDLLCTAGVCVPGLDSGTTPLDASEPLESGVPDAREQGDTGEGPDASEMAADADTDADTALDAAVADDAGEAADSGVPDAP